MPDGVFVLLTEDVGMELNQDKIDDVVLALLYLGLHDGARAWKSFDWDAMDRLHDKGYISNPQSKAKSVVSLRKGLSAPKGCLRRCSASTPDSSGSLTRASGYVHSATNRGAGECHDSGFRES
jgi:hypothetical protein